MASMTPSALPPDYDTDPGRRRSWRAPQDVHEAIAPELHGAILDIACGEGRLAAALATDSHWIGVDVSPAQLAANPYRPRLLGDMRRLPFRDATFDCATHLWCLYHLEEPSTAIAEAARVLKSGGRYYASTAARDGDPELVPEGYPPTSSDAEEALAIVGQHFDDAQAEHWNRPFFALTTRDEVRAYCRHHHLRLERADSAELPLRLTKRGVVVRAIKR
jgi:ubiquinone/menaquinone biosynthesis C-methylase UbiE